MLPSRHGPEGAAASARARIASRRAGRSSASRWCPRRCAASASLAPARPRGAGSRTSLTGKDESSAPRCGADRAASSSCAGAAPPAELRTDARITDRTTGAASRSHRARRAGYPLSTPTGRRRATLRDPGADDDIDDALDVLIGDRRFLGQLCVGRAAHHDAPRLELAAEDMAFHARLGGGAAERAAGAMTARREGHVACCVGAHQHERDGPHAPGDEHGLPDAPVCFGNLGIAGTESPRRALPVNAERAAAEFLRLGDVVGDVVDDAEISDVGNAVEHLADPVGEHLPIGPREIGGRAHGREIGLSFRGR